MPVQCMAFNCLVLSYFYKFQDNVFNACISISFDHVLFISQFFFVLFLHMLGMEVASYLSDKAASVAMVGSSTYPFERSLGQEIGKMTMQVRLDDYSLSHLLTLYTTWIKCTSLHL